MTDAPINPALAATFAPPVMAARRWLEGVTFPPERPLVNLSQAAPVDPPPAPLREAMGEAIGDPSAHIYGPVLGQPDLRAEIAARWSRAYGGEIEAAQVAVTSGCNQAFCAAIATLAQAGDNVIVPTPYYFNHAMWLHMMGIELRPLPCGDDLLPDPSRAAALMDDRTRAIVLVTPNNPTGKEYPDGVLDAFFELCQSGGLGLIVDETYRDFDSRSGAPHNLFACPDWQGTLIHLYSFSKVFRLTGHRIGALITGARRMAEVEKVLDTMTICPNQIGQRAALFGLQHLGDWVAGERAENLRRRKALEEVTDALEGWERLGSGAYFGYLRHPFDEPSDTLAQRLVLEQSLLILPGTMFVPEGDPFGGRTVRIAFANADADGLAEMGRRLAAL
ncbi:aminotransferase [Pontivivens insulae]|uniref:aspartate transaminase n=1 Tax=Pontivivens insulae TaxID=1639689 RepID=A0A2R8AAS8_9RHOB|nr:aminotransferase [Pontivivens insulae]RED13231.1 aspartate/methionine/tyrosine aminotransferase [Pontivivens insulae]SPF29323.1 Aspartate aminotransferase [Pontivivens insulae]